jgi:hypothetical protein
MKKIKILLIAFIYTGAIYSQRMNIEVDSKAKAYAIDSIQINAPIDKVYTLIATIGDWPGKMWWIKAVHNWRFETMANSGTKVTVQESFDGFGSSLMKNSLRKEARNNLVNLKKEAEKQSN